MGTQALPTTAGSAYPASASAMPESDLLTGYMPFVKVMPCVCGGFIKGDIECPAAGVREHQATLEHVDWRGRYSL